MREVPDSIAGKLGPAAAVFAGRGFEHTRLEDLAVVTGVPRATLYYYFAGKEILAWLIRGTLAAITEAVEMAAGESGRIMRMPELSAAIDQGFHLPVQRVLAEGQFDGSLRALGSAETTSAVI